MPHLAPLSLATADQRPSRPLLAQIFVRAFDFEDRLVGLAFLEVTIFVTTLRTVKNLLLMGDAVRSVSLLAFQEEPYKLVPLGRDYRQQHIVSADFLIDGDEAAFVASDREGNLRLLEYNPAHIEAEGGQRLVHASEYYHGTELSSVVMLARRTNERELVAPQSQLMLGASARRLASTGLSVLARWLTLRACLPSPRLARPQPARTARSRRWSSSPVRRSSGCRCCRASCCATCSSCPA